MTRRANREAEGGFLFINVCEPTQLRDVKQRRRVRSHVSALQHERRRHDLYAPACYTTLSEPHGKAATRRQAVPHHYYTSQPGWIPYRNSNTAQHVAHPVPQQCPQSPSDPAAETRSSTCYTGEHGLEASTFTSDSKQHALQSTDSRPPLHEHSLPRTPPRIPLYAEPRPPPDELDLKVWSLDLDTRDCVKWHMAAADHMLGDIAAYDHLSKDRLRDFIASLLKEPTFRAIFVLNGAASLRRHAAKPINTAAFVRLSDYALACVQRNVDDTKTISDATIVGVSGFAWYERCYGTPQRYAVHARGLAAMIDLRKATTVTNPYVLPIVSLLFRLTDAETAALS